jgi:hypothetical protein
MVSFTLEFRQHADIPAGLSSENLYHIGIMGPSTALSSSGLRNALRNVQRGGYQAFLSILELYSSKWKGYIGLPAHFYKERKFLIAEKGPRGVVKPLPRQMPCKSILDGEKKIMKKVSAQSSV